MSYITFVYKSEPKIITEREREIFDKFTNPRNLIFQNYPESQTQEKTNTFPEPSHNLKKIEI